MCSAHYRYGRNPSGGTTTRTWSGCQQTMSLLGRHQMRASSGLDDQSARNLLARFLFRGDEVDRQVSVLSGGERARLALARLSVREANLLVLDEPTNHLDLAAREQLENVLAGFGGTLLFVSHDRAFIDGADAKCAGFAGDRTVAAPICV